MQALRLFERFLEGRYQSEICASERDYYECWHANGLDKHLPHESAIAGALLADRLPWVFAAGYQATLRNAFPALPATGWAAFAATEDTDDPSAHPGTTLTGSDDQLRLNGTKSWVAHSRLVDQLIITVNDPHGDKRRARGVIVGRNEPGVTLTHREHPGFLAQMSQGFAAFADTPINSEDVFEFEAIRQFGRTEAKFVMLAGVAFLVARVEEASELHDRLINCGAALLSLLGEYETSRQVFASIDREFQRCVDLFERDIDTKNILGYDEDRRLFRMYCERIQRRREYAKRERVE